ncbi:MAG TPA: 6-hydroxymethylpterin diphosphokinase MptE-like protein [Spirochaetia bacterium]|nr:6-hydroxymethylpterin diphosphokinase MptE-like protein [Spirochaetia bacterium]
MEPEGFLEKNLEALATHHPGVARLLAEAQGDETEVEVIETPSGSPTAVRHGLSVHSRHDPVTEADRQAAREIDGSATCLIVLGFGLGYGTEAARRRFPELPILVLEPDAAMFRAALASRSLTRLLSDSRVRYLVAAKPEDVTPLLSSLPLARPSFLRLRPAMRGNPAWYRTAEEVVRSWLLRKEINLNTLNRFGRLWVRNLTHNMHAFLYAPGIIRLEGLCRGFPALVIAGGPSLDALLPALPSLRERLVLISVNTSLKPCAEAGVWPDFTVVVDPQYWASRFLDWAAVPGGKTVSGGIIVAEPSTQPRVLRREFAESSSSSLYLCSSLFPLGEALEDSVGHKGKLGAGGSVATAAWDLARHLGASPIYTAGLDLGFPGMRTHCRGIFTEEVWLSSCDRTRPQETTSYRYLREIGLFPARSASGGTTPSDRRMLLYQWWFESQLSMHPEARTCTLSPDSVAVAGMSLARLEDVLELPRVRDQIEARIAEERQAASRETGDHAPALRRALDDLLAGLAELEPLCERALQANDALGETESGTLAAAALLSELDDIDRRIMAVSQRSIAGFLLQSLIHRIGGKGESKVSKKEALADSAELYGGVLESARWQAAVIRKARASLAEHFPKDCHTVADLLR